MVPRTVLTRSDPILLNTARPVNTVQPRTVVNNAEPMKNVINNAYSTARRPFNKITAANNSNFTKKVNTVKGTRVNTTRPKAVLSAIKENKGNVVKASACWVWRPKYKGNPQQDLKDKGVIDSGCSRHMTGNRSYLTDYEEIDGGFVAFGGNSKGGKITRKDLGEGSGQPTNPQHTSTSAQPSNEEPITVPSSSQPKKTHKPKKAKRATEISQSSRPIPLVADETITKEWEDRMERAATTASSLEAEQDSEAQTRFKTTFKQSNDPPLSRVNTLRSGEDRLKFKELMELCTKLSDRVLDLETTKIAQVKEIANLKKRVKKLERKRKSRIPWMNLFKIGTSRRRSLGEEDASKQGRNLKQGKQMSIFKESDEGFNANMDEVFKDVEGDAEHVISAAADEVPTVTTTGVSVSTAGENITTAEPSTPLTIIVIEDEDLTITQTLMNMRSEKLKERGVVMKEPSKTATRPTIPLQKLDPKDKGKGKIVEQEKPLKKKDQIKFDEEIAQRLQVQLQDELEEEERLEKQREEDETIAEWDDVQAIMDANYVLAVRLQAEEQGELTIKEKSRLFVELMDERNRHFARLIAEEQRRKPPTKAQSAKLISPFGS
ncbi:hypothetical protein Tco_0531438 [Tanacetum coccineum]